MNIPQFSEIRRRLLKITVDCREDMHEPDNQDISATVIGDHLDNAMGNYIGDDQSRQEFVVIIKNESSGEEEAFNLADLIALARKAQFHNFDNPEFENIMNAAGFVNSNDADNPTLYFTENGVTVDLERGISAVQLRKIVAVAKETGGEEALNKVRIALFGEQKS